MTRLSIPFLALSLVACAGPLGGPPFEGVAPTFSLLDVNETSVTAGQMVAPEDYRGEVSAWYFGHAT